MGNGEWRSDSGRRDAMGLREDIETALRGGRPERTPFTCYEGLMPDGAAAAGPADHVGNRRIARPQSAARSRVD